MTPVQPFKVRIDGSTSATNLAADGRFFLTPLDPTHVSIWWRTRARSSEKGLQIVEVAVAFRDLHDGDGPQEWRPRGVVALKVRWTSIEVFRLLQHLMLNSPLFLLLFDGHNLVVMASSPLKETWLVTRTSNWVLEVFALSEVGETDEQDWKIDWMCHVGI